METIKQFIKGLFSSIKKFFKKMAKVFIYIDPKSGEDKTRGTKDKDACDEELSLTLSFEDGSHHLKSKTFPTNIITKFEYDSTCVGDKNNPVRFQITKDNGETITYTTIAWDSSWNLSEKRVRLNYGTRITPDLTDYNGKVHIMVELSKKEGSSTNKVYSNEIVWEKEEEEKANFVSGEICIMTGETMTCNPVDYEVTTCDTCHNPTTSIPYSAIFTFDKGVKTADFSKIDIFNNGSFLATLDIVAVDKQVFGNNTFNFAEDSTNKDNILVAKLYDKSGSLVATSGNRKIRMNDYRDRFTTMNLTFKKLDKGMATQVRVLDFGGYTMPVGSDTACVGLKYLVTGKLYKNNVVIKEDNFGWFTKTEFKKLIEDTKAATVSTTELAKHYDQTRETFDVGGKILLTKDIASFISPGTYKYELNIGETIGSGNFVSCTKTITTNEEEILGDRPSVKSKIGFSFYASRIDNRGSYGTNKAYYDEEESKIKTGNVVNGICYVSNKKFKYGVSLGLLNANENPTISDSDVYKILVFRKGKEYNNGNRSLWTAVSDRTVIIHKQELVDNKLFWTEEVISQDGRESSLENEEFRFEVYKNDVLLNDYYYSTESNKNVRNEELSNLIQYNGTSPEYRFKLAYYKSSIEFEDLTLFITKAHASNYGDQEKFSDYNLNIDYVAKMSNSAECLAHNKEFIYTINFNVERTTIMEGSEGVFSPYLENSIPEINVTVYGNQDSRNHNNVGNPQEHPLTLEKGFIYRVKVIAKLMPNSDSDYISESIINGVLQEKTFYTTTVTLPEINSI